MPAAGLFRRGGHSISVEAEYIHAELQGAARRVSSSTRSASREVDPERLLEVRLRRARTTSQPARGLGRLLDACSGMRISGAVQTIQRLVREPLALKARNGVGEYRAMSLLLLPGEIVDDDAGEDAGGRRHALPLGGAASPPSPGRRPGPVREGGHASNHGSSTTGAARRRPISSA